MRAYAALLLSFASVASFASQKEEVLRAVLPAQVTLIVTKQSDIANRKIILRDFTIATSPYIPVFTSPDTLAIFLKEQPEVRKAGDQMIFMDRVLFAQVLRGQEIIVIDPGTDLEVKTTASLLKASLVKKEPNKPPEATPGQRPPASPSPSAGAPHL
jgi:hypothetical protein